MSSYYRSVVNRFLVLVCNQKVNQKIMVCEMLGFVVSEKLAKKDTTVANGFLLFHPNFCFVYVHLRAQVNDRVGLKVPRIKTLE